MKSIKTILLGLAATVRARGLRRNEQNRNSERQRRLNRRRMASGIVEQPRCRRHIHVVRRRRHIRHLPAALQADLLALRRDVPHQRQHSERNILRRHAWSNASYVIGFSDNGNRLTLTGTTAGDTAVYVKEPIPSYILSGELGTKLATDEPEEEPRFL